MANLTKKELFNAKNNGESVKDGLSITLVGVGTFADTDKDGHAVNVSVLKANDGKMYTTISATIYESLDLLEDILNDEKEVSIVVHEKTSSNNRQFLQLEIL